MGELTQRTRSSHPARCYAALCMHCARSPRANSKAQGRKSKAAACRQQPASKECSRLDSLRAVAPRGQPTDSTPQGEESPLTSFDLVARLKPAAVRSPAGPCRREGKGWGEAGEER